jgi:hypothetical protein
MAFGSSILDKLITDFSALEFEGGELLFNNVKSSYRESIRGARDAVLLPDDDSEFIRGNQETDRNYGFFLSAIEETNSVASDTVTQNMYYRLMNIRDGLLDYLQKEPSNLRQWALAQSPQINIFKNRLNQVLFNEGESPNGGYAVEMQFRFTVFVNINPKLL